MGRGRPRLYNTPEEKAAANREKSKRCYHKRKIAAQSSRRPRYRADIPQNKPIKGATRDTHPPGADPVDVPSCSLLIARLEQKFKSLTNNSVYNYVDSLYQEYTLKYWPEVFSDALLEVQSLHKRMERCQHILLQLKGVGEEYKRAEKVRKEMNDALKCLDELECYAAIGKAEVIDSYSKCELMYQALVH
ncbi:hypothetical protein EYR36_009372 [Pleurotus pulmonarius]|nr:hypothetical protein EYR36_009372 [Pleurotus pulmonarius]KAF4592868.1 hypothetical protein EYR38_008574 [Pleurotus pulmonarius]